VRSGVRVVVEDGRIEALVDAAEPSTEDDAYPEATLLPGLVDLQVNGGNGAAYDSQDPKERERATRHHLERGTTSLLAALMTAPLEHLHAALTALASDVDASGPVVGVHLEGPFLSAEKSGAHAAASLCDPSLPLVDGMLARAKGTLRMVTLAPELPGAPEAIARFAESGVVVAAGHSVATQRELERAIDAGLSFVTHLGNASDWPGRPFDEQLQFRRSEPGLVGTFLFDTRLSGSLILDGFHLHPGLARALVLLRGPDHLVLVSDATPAAGLGPGRYQMGGLDAQVHEGGYATTGQGLAGSVITLLDAVRVAVEQAGLSLTEAVGMASATPAQVIGLADRKGALAPGLDADLLLVGRDWSPAAVYRAGKRV
jgi:N-acetylglucosamine-6-phosphate deacetylase